MSLHDESAPVHSDPEPTAWSWGPETDADRWELGSEPDGLLPDDGPEPDDDGDFGFTLPALTFPEQIRTHATFTRSAGTTAARWLAGELDQLATLAEQLHAATPDEMDGRRKVMEDGRDERRLYRAYADGRADAAEIADRLLF
jgi:hypothetical protein